MWTPGPLRGDKPIFQAIADAVAADVRAGRLAPGARLPPLRELAAELGVDFTTVSRAYAEARRRGLITSRVGQGTFVARRTEDYAPAESSAGPVDMSMNLPPQFADAALVERMWAAVPELQLEFGADLLLRYQQAAGAPNDRRAGLAWLADRIPGLAFERVLVSAGAQPALVAVMADVAGPQDVIGADALTYPGARGAAAHLGVSLAGLATDAEGVLPDAFETLCREAGPKALYCTPTFQNPTTATMGLERRREIVRIARRYRVLLIEDDAYGKLPARPPPALAALAPEITYHVAGLAKAVSPALRIAYVATPDARAAERVAARLRALTGMASPLTAALATRWIETGVAAQVLGAIRAETIARRRIAGEILGAPHGAPAEAFHLWLPLPKGWSRASFQSQLARRQLAAVPSDAFAITPHAPEAVRVGLGAASSREGMRRALEAMADVLAGAPGWATSVV